MSSMLKKIEAFHNRRVRSVLGIYSKNTAVEDYLSTSDLLINKMGDMKNI